jgi:peptide-methionine (S)-S-oxide reductase
MLLIFFASCLVGCQGDLSKASPKDTPKADANQCKISLIDDEQQPEFMVNTDALKVPENDSKYRKAYFSMGCFWGSEALLGSANGVLSTQVGFAGGSLPNPTYSAIGDHVETVQVVYDPEVIDYSALLKHFWSHHNSRAKPIFRQYASAIFCKDSSELLLAKEQRKEWQATTGEDKILTAILKLDKFYPAGDAHQKYYLQQDPKLLESLPDTESRLQTLLATKLNAVSGRAGDRNELETGLSQLGIDGATQKILFKRAVWPDSAAIRR